MEFLDPLRVLKLLEKEIPARVRGHIVMVGSLAAAYHHKERLGRQGIATKDADFLVHPAGGKNVARELARTLLAGGWSRSVRQGKECFPMPRGTSPDKCRAIRLLPPKRSEFYLEILGLPKRDQRERLVWQALDLDDGRYALPCFRFMGLAVEGARETPEGFKRASAAMMGLSHLLSHPEIGIQRIRDEEGVQRETRSAKDLGRALALWFLADERERDSWLHEWIRGLRRRFPKTWRKVAGLAGKGLRALVGDRAALQEAYELNRVGLMNRMEMTPGNLAILAEELLQGPIAGLQRQARAGS